MLADDPPRSALEEQLVIALIGAAPAAGETAPKEVLWRLFDAQVASRHCDLAARWLRSQGLGYYTISSAGHESNAAVALVLRPGDPALLHYRSGGFFLARAGIDGVGDIMAGVCAATSEPISGGRHKVFGRHDLAIIPQTSTIASHLPRAVGVAFAIDRAARVGVESAWAPQSIAVCSFGDASVNHAAAQAAFNTAEHCAHQRLGMPLLFVCEDNGLGISVRTPSGWIETAFGHRPHLQYVAAEGDDPSAVLRTTGELAEWVRRTRRPAFLHLRTVRFGGHAGTDAEAAYRTPAELAADAVRDPILGTARQLLAAGATVEQLLDRHDTLRADVYAAARHAATLPQLDSAEAVMGPLARPVVAAIDAPAGGKPLTVAQAVNTTLGEMLDARPSLLVFGEDVGVKGGVYGVTKGLANRAGRTRVFDTLLDETSILGLANGAAISGLLPVPEIQYLAYLHNAEDQLRGEAATLAFFSNGQYRNGMVVRVAGYGYQQGFGGHFHNDDSIAVLRDIPGLVIASPARPDDAGAMLRTCIAAAEHGAVCVFIEPIALYHTQDLHEPGDRGWLANPGGTAELGRARTHGDGDQLTIVTSGNGLFMALRVARRLATRDVRARVVDLRWIAPLPVDDIRREAEATGTVLVVDETRATGGISEAVVAALIDGGFTGRIARVASKDSPIPLGDAARLVLLSEAEIEAAADRLVR